MSSKDKSGELAHPVKPEVWQNKTSKERITYPPGQMPDRHVTWGCAPYTCPELTHRSAGQRQTFIALTGRPL